MKKPFLLIFVLLHISFAFAQDIENEVSTLIKEQIKKENISKWELYPTENIWTFLKLNTSNGVIYQIQFSLNNKTPDLEVPINSYPLVDGEDAIIGRFKLYPTKNIYNFLLLDKISGKVYTAQWSEDYNKRFIRTISEGSN